MKSALSIKTIFTLFIFIILNQGLLSQTYSSNNINLISVIDPETQFYGAYKYSGCWGWYQESKNKEYALVQGSIGNLYFIDISTPLSPQICDTVIGGGSINREVKTYQNYCYSIRDQGNGDALQIIDMQYLPDSVHLIYTGSTYFKAAHTLFIDNDKLYLSSVTYTGSTNPLPTSNLNIYSLATPSAPVLLRSLNQDYPNITGVHDVFVRNDTIFASCMNQGLFVFKYNSINNNFIQIGSLSNYTDNGYNHSSSLTSDGKTLIMCDEIPNGLSIKSVNVTNLSNINIASIFKPYNDPNFVAHNPYVKENKWAYVSCYQDGLMIYDISNPSLPLLAGYFDTFYQGGANTGAYIGSNSLTGNWGAYPYFPSGLIITLDTKNGLFVLQTDPAINVKKNLDGNINMIKTYPNPANKSFTINFTTNKSGKLNYTLKNIIGQTIYSGEDYYNSFCTWERELNTANLDNGFYFLSISINNNTSVQKITIIH